MSTQPRSRTFTWQDPLPAARAGLALSGFDYLTAMMRGEIPGAPIASTLGFNQFPIQVEPGKVTFSLQPEEFHYNPIGSVHGGVICTLLDSASACAVHSLLPAGTGYTSLELKVNFIRAVTAKSGLMRCVGTVINLGRRTAVAEARLIDESGKLYALCTQTCLILAPES
jgi:uncharacterized protein (TIGR00369 family)